MKANLKTKEIKKGFEPITIELVIESKQDIVNLYCNLNVSFKYCVEENKMSINKVPTEHAMALFGIVEGLAKEYGLKK